MIKRFDIVRIKTIDRVTWLSGPASRPAPPQGNWSVVAGVGADLLMLAKDETIIQIPISDVLKVADYDIKHALESIKKIRSHNDLKKFPLSKEMKNVKKERKR